MMMTRKVSITKSMYLHESIIGGPNTYYSADVAVGTKMYRFGGYDATRSSVIDTGDVLEPQCW